MVPGQAVTIWGAGEGLELALELSRQGRTVRVIDENPGLVPAPYMASRVMHALKWLGEPGFRWSTVTGCSASPNDGLAVECRGEAGVAAGAPAGVATAVAKQVATEVEILQSDSVVVCLGREANNPLRQALDGKVRELFVIGDAKEPRSYGNAIHEAAYLARQIRVAAAAGRDSRRGRAGWPAPSACHGQRKTLREPPMATTVEDARRSDGYRDRQRERDAADAPTAAPSATLCGDGHQETQAGADGADAPRVSGLGAMDTPTSPEGPAMLAEAGLASNSWTRPAITPERAPHRRLRARARTRPDVHRQQDVQPHSRRRTVGR